MAKYSSHLSAPTPQTEPDPSRMDQVQNSAGGYVFSIDCWSYLDRFLVLGTEGGTYYASERKLTLENATNLVSCLRADPRRTVARIVEMSTSGRIIKNDTAIFALAVCCARGALALVEEMGALLQVCRTGTHILHFVSMVRELRGSSPALLRLINSWYSQAPDQLGFQVTKYVQRDGMSHRDVLRLARPKGATPEHAALYRWIVKGRKGLGARTVTRNQVTREYPAVDESTLPAIVDLYDRTKAATTKAEVLKCIEDGAPREFLEGSHSQFLSDRDIWAALLVKMPLTAMLRNLNKMTAVGLFDPFSTETELVCNRLADTEYLRKSRVHPVAVLVANRVYARGRGVKGSLQWTPNQRIIDATDAAFYATFGNVIPTRQRLLLALDVSGSMSCSLNKLPLSAAEAAAALALVTANVESNVHIVGYSTQLCDLPISPKMRLNDVLSITQRMSFGGTDCALPFTVGRQRGWKFDACVSYTDNETWAGPEHVHQAIRDYRKRSGIPAKFVACAFTATQYSVADPRDAGSLNVVGFDTATPELISQFIRGYDSAPSSSEVQVED